MNRYRYLVAYSLISITSLAFSMEQISPSTTHSNNSESQKRIYVGIRFNGISLYNDKHQDFTTDLMSILRNEGDLSDRYNPDLHVTLFNGRISETDQANHAQDLANLKSDIARLLTSFKSATITKTEIVGLWAGRTTRGTSAYNIVLPLTQPGNHFITMAESINNLIKAHNLENIIIPMNYKSYNESLEDWDFQCQANINDNSMYDLSQGFLHTTLLTAYKVRPTVVSELDDYTKMLKNIITDGMAKISQMTLFENFTPQDAQDILTKTFLELDDQIQDANNLLAQFKDKVVKEIQLRNNQITLNGIHEIIGKVTGRLKGALAYPGTRSNPINYSFNERIASLKEAVQSYIDEQEPEDINNLSNIGGEVMPRMSQTLMEETKMQENQKADQFCLQVKSLFPMSQAEFTWDSIEFKGFE